MISRLHKTLMSMLLSLALAVSPLHATVNTCSEPCEENSCCQEGYNWKKWLGSAVLVGSAAGAVVAGAVATVQQGIKGKKGEIGPVGPQGPTNPFETDATNTLTFGGSVTTLLSPPFPAGTEATFFVTSPDGQTTSGASILLDTASGTIIPFPSITVPAIFGSYTTGLEVRIPPTSVASTGSLVEALTVDASNPLIPHTLVGTNFPLITYTTPAPQQIIQLDAHYDYYPQHGTVQ